MQIYDYVCVLLFYRWAAYWHRATMAHYSRVFLYISIFAINYTTAARCNQLCPNSRKYHIEWWRKLRVWRWTTPHPSFVDTRHCNDAKSQQKFNRPCDAMIACFAIRVSCVEVSSAASTMCACVEKWNRIGANWIYMRPATHTHTWIAESAADDVLKHSS